MTPLVSICIPCYNAQTTIERTIRSVLTQTYSNIEIIISDNASTDRTVDAVQKIQDERIKLFVSETNLGMARNFKASISHASGKYVKCLCADDTITADCIEKQVNAFLSNPDDNIVMVTSDKYVINQSNKILFKMSFPGKEGVYDGKKIARKSLYGTNIFGEPGCVMFDRETARKTDEFVIDDSLLYVMDLHFYCQLLQYGNLFVVKEPLFSVRVIDSCASAGFKWNQARIFNALIDKYYNENFIKMGWINRVLGKTMSWIMCFARNLVFKFAN